MTLVDLDKVRQLRQKLADSGIIFDLEAFEIGKRYTENDLSVRAEARTLVYEQLVERGVPSGQADVIICRIQGATLKEAGQFSRTPVTPEGARQRIIGTLNLLGKERG